MSKNTCVNAEILYISLFIITMNSEMYSGAYNYLKQI